MKRHVVLVGLPGSGKTTVGGLVAERLQATFVDVDAVLVRVPGEPHGIRSRPSHHMEKVDYIRSWFAKYRTPTTP